MGSHRKGVCRNEYAASRCFLGHQHQEAPQENSQNQRKPQDTSGHLRKPQETSGDLRRSQETSGSQEASGDLRRHQENQPTAKTCFGKVGKAEQVEIICKKAVKTHGFYKLFQLFSIFSAKK